MRKLIATSVLLLAALCANAQIFSWALFPKGEKETEPEVSEAAEAAATDSTAVSAEGNGMVTLTAVLPFTGDNSTNAYDFYSGILLAARDLGNSGIDVVVNAYDINDTLNVVTSADLFGSDIIIGPFTNPELKRTLEILPEGSHLISPLSNRVQDLTVSEPLIQVPTPVETQIRSVAEMLKEDYIEIDSVYVFKEDNVQMPQSAYLLMETLDSLGVPYDTLSYNILKSLELADTLIERERLSPWGHTRFVIASERLPFVTDAVRNVNVLTFKGMDVALYCCSKVKGYEKIDVSDYHNVEARVANNYFINYSDSKVVEFSRTYRTLLGVEPTKFSFQGYDVAHYFINAAYLFGEEWYDFLPEYDEQGMQISFDFDRSETAGNINTGVRKVIYNRNYSFTVKE